MKTEFVWLCAECGLWVDVRLHAPCRCKQCGTSGSFYFAEVEAETGRIIDKGY